MSDFPAAGVMTGPTPPGYGGASGVVNTPAPAFTQSARHEQRAAEQEQRTYDRWTTTGGGESITGDARWQVESMPSGPLQPIAAGKHRPGPPTFQCAKADEHSGPLHGTSAGYAASSAPLRKSPWWRWT